MMLEGTDLKLLNLDSLDAKINNIYNFFIKKSSIPCKYLDKAIEYGSKSNSLSIRWKVARLAKLYKSPLSEKLFINIMDYLVSENLYEYASMAAIEAGLIQDASVLYNKFLQHYERELYNHKQSNYLLYPAGSLHKELLKDEAGILTAKIKNKNLALAAKTLGLKAKYKEIKRLAAKLLK